MQDIHPERPTSALFIPFVTAENHDKSLAANEWVSEQIAEDFTYGGLFFVRPEDNPEWVRDNVKRLGLHGFKCYHTMVAVDPTWEADVETFLPESLVKVAHGEGLAITLHMVKSHAVADSANIEWIRRSFQSYPNMNLILAYSARGFQSAHNLEGITHLVGLENLCFDTSVNCEPVAHQAIIRLMGRDRLMYGTHPPVGHVRDRSLSAFGQACVTDPGCGSPQERRRTMGVKQLATPFLS